MRTVFQQARHCLITFNSIDIFQNLYFSIALASGCVPIVAGHDHILPYENLIDWSLAVDRIGVQEIFFLDHFLTPGSDLRKKRQQGLYLFQQYFSSIDKVSIVLLELIVKSFSRLPNHFFIICKIFCTSKIADLNSGMVQSRSFNQH